MLKCRDTFWDIIMWGNFRTSDPISLHWKTKCGFLMSNLLQNLCHILHWRKSRDVCYQESFGYMKDASANTACKRLGACFLVQFFLQVQTSMSRGRNGRHEAGQSNCWSESLRPIWFHCWMRCRKKFRTLEFELFLGKIEESRWRFSLHRKNFKLESKRHMTTSSWN